jgi:uncharacterized protein YndB with AHSA1/START domain
VIDYSIWMDAPAATVFVMLTEADLLTEWMAREAEVDRRPAAVGGPSPPGGPQLIARAVNNR